MKEYQFSMSVSPEQCKRFYQGVVRAIVVTCDNGVRVQIPALKFRPFISSDGVRGRFRLILDDNNKMIALEKTY